jgi:hypothetical protein
MVQLELFQLEGHLFHGWENDIVGGPARRGLSWPPEHFMAASAFRAVPMAFKFRPFHEKKNSPLSLPILPSSPTNANTFTTKLQASRTCVRDTNREPSFNHFSTRTHQH